MSLSLFKKRMLITMAMVVFTSFSFAQQTADKAAIDKAAIDKAAIDKAAIDQITAKMEALQIPVASIAPSVIDGLYQVLTNNGLYYVSQNAQFLVHGSIYDLDHNMENFTEKSLMAVRKSKLKAFEKDMIIYKAPEEKHVITVFTDTSCGYCQKLHSEMADYHKFGITVRYLAFPRGGLKSATYNSMVSIWCADDKEQAMDNAKKRRAVEPKTCKNNVKEQYELGLSLGVTGTPAIVLEDGSLKPGYIPADRLIKLLESKSK